MKILKHGANKKPKVKMYGTCNSCGCRVECTADETRYEEDRPGDGANCVNCPECDNKFLWVK